MGNDQMTLMNYFSYLLFIFLFFFPWSDALVSNIASNHGLAQYKQEPACENMELFGHVLVLMFLSALHESKKIIVILVITRKLTNEASNYR